MDARNLFSWEEELSQDLISLFQLPPLKIHVVDLRRWKASTIGSFSVAYTCKLLISYPIGSNSLSHDDYVFKKLWKSLLENRLLRQSFEAFHDSR